MSLGTHQTRVGQATQPGAVLPDAALLQQADAYDARPRQKTDFFKALGLHGVLIILALSLSLPFVWMVMTSLKPVAQVESENWVPTHVEMRDLAIPGTGVSLPIPANYYNVFDVNNPDINNRGVPFHLYFRNSLFVAAWVTFLQVLTSAMAAYSFARLQWPGRDKIFLLYLSTMMLPGLVMMIPNYEIMIRLGLVDTLPGLIIPAAFSAFGTFLLRQFMLTIPSSLDEAAEIDGASKFRVFWDVILPLARPGLVTLTIFTFMGNYNSFFWPLVMIRTEERYTLPIGLLFFDSTRGQATHLLMAGVTMSVIPMIIVFVLMQKQLVKGIQLGAVKG